ncbi:pirin family protein [Chthonobacter rhizosphaerae]|uniref:pirin family protein n=1 Tax=Chthonobacter rhizosphaerae TaxID=2735553 RepID=UPI0015EF4719|nr:pirin family protein [Chthonobacter rhizosphaerae]
MTPTDERSSLPQPNPAIETVIVPRARDLGGFEVRRALPAAGRRMVGPFVFLDQMGPAEFITGQGIDVRPHPHIGLATVTYLYQGEIMHRDSLGTELPIRPGDVNWMTAGRGITHSERTSPALKASGSSLFGIQSWVALPKAHEETAPAFAHVGKADLPALEAEGKKVRMIAGSLWGLTSPVETLHETIYADAILSAGASLPIPATHEERAIYTLSGTVTIAGDAFGPGRLLVFRPGDAITVTAAEDARVLVLGGEPMDGPRHIWWNFVSSDPDRIEAAKAAWKAGAFPKVPGDGEFIPLPA